LSAKTGTASRIAGLESGADLYMLKPFDKDELRVQMRNLLDRYTRFHTRYENPNLIAADEKPEVIKEDEFITRVRTVVVDRLDDSEFSVFDLERGVFLSRSQLHKKLKALTGMSATQFINRVRLTAARDLLKDDSLSIADIAYRVGYTDPNYFTRIFVESFGETPSDTRKTHKASVL
jgi:AraC-like DNA-binding protein